MSLEEYKKKRSFNKTPEPTGGEGTADQLRFVVQKHAASHLHYDFRLEVRGVLKSWAVPKGPSTDTEVKRLAMLVEDHPYDYKSFEGIIPAGNYGAGSVIVWDEGTFETPAIKEKDKKAQEHSLLSQFYKGSIAITLHGHKLKGKFQLVRAKDKDERSWYLIKLKDRYASSKDITKENKSVVSGLTVEEMKENPAAREWKSNRSNEGNANDEDKADLDVSILQKGTTAPIPTSVEPMACTLIREPFNDPSWVYEIKLDGFRIIAYIKNGNVTLQSRSGLDYTKYYPLVAKALKDIKTDAVIDGELVVPDEKGRPDFDALQKYKGQGPILYYTFDVIWLDGYDVMNCTLLERKMLLQQLIPQSDVIKYSEHFEDGDLLLEQVKQLQLEGIVAKRKDSCYQPGKRSKDWLKLPTEIKQEFVIGGWTESDSGRPFRSLVFGAYDDGKLTYIGHAGLGFKEAEMAGILQRLQKLQTDKNPFVNKVDTDTPVHYVKPVQVANFRFATWTAGGKIRKPATFLGFRKDKVPTQVIREVPLAIQEEQKIIHTASAKDAMHETTTSEDSNWRVIEKEKITTKETFDIEGKPVLITNIEKELWKGITKAHLIEYYHSVAAYILPYLVYRPQSLHIKHIRATAPGLYIKDMEGRQPEWATIFTTERKHKKKGKRDVIDYLVCNDEATLLYMINLGCIDINPWTSQITHPIHPDFIIIDLDPSDDDFKKAIETARAAKEYFDSKKLKAFPKTSGKTGIHLYIPCSGFSFNEARNIAEKICYSIHQLVPSITTTEITISKRGNRLYIDPNQNDEADTVAAPYSVRPFHHPSVSTPVEWKEINEHLDPLEFNIHTITKRLEKKGDIFIKVLDKKVQATNNQILRNLLL